MGDNSFPYWGIDGCKSGWLCIGLNDAGKHHFIVGCCIDKACESIKQQGAKIALIDIPIGLRCDENERECDKLARKKVGNRRSSVFRVPCRQAIEAYKEGRSKAQREEKGKIASVEVTGLCLSVQTWGIAGKIADVDTFMHSKQDENFSLRETHPEVCFCALNRNPLNHSKRNIRGKQERLEILSKHVCDAEYIKSEICKSAHKEFTTDDVLDALVAAVTAKMIALRCSANTLPCNPPRDSRGLPMEIVFAAV